MGEDFGLYLHNLQPLSLLKNSDEYKYESQVLSDC